MNSLLTSACRGKILGIAFRHTPAYSALLSEKERYCEQAQISIFIDPAVSIISDSLNTPVVIFSKNLLVKSFHIPGPHAGNVLCTPAAVPPSFSHTGQPVSPQTCLCRLKQVLVHAHADLLRIGKIIVSADYDNLCPEFIAYQLDQGQPVIKAS